LPALRVSAVGRENMPDSSMVDNQKEKAVE
jgi:hypothetical protein